MNKIATPDTLPETTARWVIELPDAPLFVSCITGLLIELAQPCAWEPNTGLITPAEMAEAFTFILDQWLLKETCP